MTASVIKSRGSLGLGIVTLVILVVLLGLGVWQLQRRTQKHLLIAALTERLAGQPQPLPPPSQWPALTAEHDEFRRVAFEASIDTELSARVYSAGSALRRDVSGPGYWVFAPARLPSGDIIPINRGFLTLEQTASGPGGKTLLTGYIRFPEPKSWFTPSFDYVKGIWYHRDPLEMATVLEWLPPQHRLAPFYIDLESPMPASGIPKPGPLDVQLKDDHMQYAITWFGLAAAVLVAFGVWLKGQRKV